MSSKTLECLTGSKHVSKLVVSVILRHRLALLLARHLWTREGSVMILFHARSFRVVSAVCCPGCRNLRRTKSQLRNIATWYSWYNTGENKSKVWKQKTIKAAILTSPYQNKLSDIMNIRNGKAMKRNLLNEMTSASLEGSRRGKIQKKVYTKAGGEWLSSPL